MGRSRAHKVPFLVQLSPPPPMAQCWALPGGNPFNVSAIHLPGVPSAPPSLFLLSCFRGMEPEARLGRPENKQERRGGD